MFYQYLQLFYLLYRAIIKLSLDLGRYVYG